MFRSFIYALFRAQDTPEPTIVITPIEKYFGPDGPRCRNFRRILLSPVRVDVGLRSVTGNSRDDRNVTFPP